MGHTVIVPYPGQGHINPMVQLAIRLCDLRKELVVTLAFTRSNLENILGVWKKSDTILPHNLRLRAFRDDVLPKRSMESIVEFMNGVQMLKSSFLELVDQMHQEKDGGGKISCIISDTMLAWVPEAANEIGVPWIAFFPLPVSSMLVYLNKNLLEEQGVRWPINREEDDRYVHVPGLRFAPKVKDLTSRVPSVEFLDDNLIKAAWIIVNTCSSLEFPELEAASELLGLKNLRSVGPLQPREVLEGSDDTVTVTGTMCEQESSAISWLDKGPPMSTVYVSFGSIASTTLENLKQLLQALVDSGERFLWVLRKEYDEEEYSKFVTTAAESGRGFVVSWAPQLQILRHPSVAAFLTHCGWNSTFESICAGVPMITWPCFADQHMNATYIEDVWKVGVRISVDMDMGNVVKGIIRDNELRHRVIELGKKCLNDSRIESKEYLTELLDCM